MQLLNSFKFQDVRTASFIIINPNLLTQGDDGLKGTQTFATGVASARAVVGWAIEQIHIASRVHSHWAVAAKQSVLVLAFNGEHSVFHAIAAFVRLPASHPRAVFRVVDTCKKMLLHFFLTLCFFFISLSLSCHLCLTLSLLMSQIRDI
jgi:hypothetical protein